MKRIIILLLIAACRMGDASPRQYVDETVAQLQFPGMSFTVAYARCGTPNAVYLPSAHILGVCQELLAQPEGFVRFVIAHEIGHAIIDQYQLPIPGSEEAAADEFAAIALAATDHTAAVLEAAVWFEEHPDGGEDVEDDHQSSAKRAAVLICLGDGAESDYAITECRIRFLHAADTWRKLISIGYEAMLQEANDR